MEGTIKSITQCPTCGSECDVNTNGVTHYYISKTATLQAELEKAKELLREFERGKNGKLNFQEINDFQDRVTQFLEAK